MTVASISESVVLKGNASTRFVKTSVMTRIYLNPVSEVSIGTHDIPSDNLKWMGSFDGFQCPGLVVNGWVDFSFGIAYTHEPNIQHQPHSLASRTSL